MQALVLELVFCLTANVLLQRGKAFGCPKVCSEGTLCYAKAARTGLPS